MNVGRLVLGVGADLSEMQAGFTRGAAVIQQFAARADTTLAAGFNKAGASVQQFSSEVQRSLDAADKILTAFAASAGGKLSKTNLFGELNTQAKQAAAGLLQQLETDFASGIGNVREELVRGLVSPAEFQETATVAAEVFNRSLLAGIDRLAARNLISPRTRAGLITQLKDVGTAGGLALSDGLNTGSAAAATATRNLTTLGNTGPHVARGMNMVRSGMQAVAAQTVGVSGSLGTVLSGLLMFGAGSAAVTGIVAGIGLLAAAWRLFTKDARDAADATRKLINDIAARIQSRRQREDPVGFGLEQLKGIEAEAIRVNQLLAEALNPAPQVVQRPLGGIITIPGFVSEKDVADLRARLAVLGASSAEIGKEMQEGLAALAPPIVKTVDEVAAEFTALQGRVGNVLTVLKSTVAAHRDATIPLTAARDLLTDINGRIAAQHGLILPNTGALLTMRDALAEALLPAAQANSLISQFGIITLDNVAALVDLVIQLKAVNDNLVQPAKITPQEIKTGGIKDIKTTAEGAKKPVKDLLGDITKIGTGLQGILQGASGFKLLGDNAQQAISGVLGLLQAVEQLKAAQQAAADAGEKFSLGSVAGITSMVGIIGAAVGILGSLFGGGPSPSDELLAQNSAALKALKSSLDHNTITTELLLTAQRALGHLDLTAILQARGGAKVPNTGAQMAELQRQLQAFGLTFADLQRIAKDNGLSLLDSNGHLVAATLAQLNELLGLTIGDMTKFGKGLDDQRTLLEAQNKIFQVAKTPGQDITNIGTLLAGQSTAMFDRIFGGVDTATAAGQAELRKRIQSVFTDIANGTLSAADFGKLDKTQLLDLILGISDALDGMTGAVDKVTHALIGVPDAFRLAFRTAEAQMALEPGIGPIPILPPPPVEIGDLLPFQPGGGPVPILPPEGPQTLMFQFGDIILTGESGKDPEAQVAQFLTLVKQKAKAVGVHWTGL